MSKSQESKNFKETSTICFFNYDLGFGGTEKVIVSLANYFSLLGRKVTILTLSDRNDFAAFLQPEIKIVSLKVDKIKLALPKLIHFIMKNKFDNFFSNVWPLTSVSFIVRIFSPKTKLLFVEHCNISMQFQNRSYLFKLFQKISISLFYKFADHVIAVSIGVKEDLLSMNVTKDKIQVIYNPVITKSLKEENISNLAIKNWTKSKHKKLIAVGEFKAQKNFLNLVEAIYFAKCSLNLDLSLLILGDGEQMSYISSQITKMDLEERIFLAGWVNDPLPYYNLADLFVLSSDYEGFGVVIVEAMSCGLNIVSTDCKSGPSEILMNGDLGTLCKVNDPESLANAIMHALKHPFDKDTLVRRAEDFSEKKIGKLYEEIII
jgi:glycosyltransferase involved in cell wall biosynthesis